MNAGCHNNSSLGRDARITLVEPGCSAITRFRLQEVLRGKSAKPNSDEQERSSIYNQFANMKAYVTVMLKTTVLDPQGKTIHGALKKMGYRGVDAVRQGKFFELNLDGGLDKNAARAEVERIAKEVLTNPVIEEFSYRIEE
jgi:phosphoribosylformylglycinamidine synthase